MFNFKDVKKKRVNCYGLSSFIIYISHDLNFVKTYLDENKNLLYFNFNFIFCFFLV